MEEKSKPQKHGGNGNGDLALGNGGPGSSDAHDQLVQMVMELKLQNEFLKSQFEGFQNFQQTEPSETEGGKSEEVEQLRQTIESLNVELLEEKQTRAAAEVALKHLREAHSEADSKAQELSAKLAEGLIMSLHW